MTRPPEIQLERSAVAARRGRRLLPPARYRHPGDIIRLITAGFVLIGASAVTAATQGTYAGASAVVVTAVAPSTTAGRMLAGLVQTVFIAAAGVAVVVTLRSGRYRLLAGLAGSAVLASATVTGIIYLAGGERPRAMTAGAGPWSWLTGASLVGPALGAAAVACTVAAAPWLARPWRRAAFAELGATQRQIELDVAELLASLAVIAGAERAVATAVAVIGPDRVAAAVPLLQPLALSAGTRRAIARHNGLLTLWGSRARPLALTWACMRPARTRC